MGVARAGLSVQPSAGSREAEALDIIVDRLAAGVSPTAEEIAFAMRPPVSRSRVRELLDRLEKRGAITRRPGALRSIQVPSLPTDLVIAALTRSGWVVNPDNRTLMLPGCQKGQLPVLPPLVHIPDDFSDFRGAGQNDAGDYGGVRKRA